MVAHWAWSEGGWASARTVDEGDLLFGCGVTDFAGSGVVHMTGGMAALVGIFILGPRAGRFNEDGTSNTMPQQSAVLQVCLFVLESCLWSLWVAVVVIHVFVSLLLSPRGPTVKERGRRGMQICPPLALSCLSLLLRFPPLCHGVMAE